MTTVVVEGYLRTPFRTMHLQPHPACLAAFLGLFVACAPKPASDPTAGTGSSEPTATAPQLAPASEEDAWRKPEVLVSIIPPVVGKSVAVLFAGDGYYAFKLVEAGARVIAIEPDGAQAGRLREAAAKRGIGTDRLEVRQVAQGTGLNPGEADMAFCSRSYLTVPDRINYFRQVRSALKSPAPLVLVDFAPAESPVGPPVSERISEQAVMDEMELLGCTDIGAYGKKLPYQWVVIAMDFVPDPDAVEVAP